MATDQLSPERGSSVPQVERLSLNDGELSELERGKKKSITTGLDDPQQCRNILHTQIQWQAIKVLHVSLSESSTQCFYKLLNSF